jgi:hypothetical protein
MTFSVNGDVATQWRKSTYSGYSDCVELLRLPHGDVAIRDSKAPMAASLVFPSGEVKAFLKAAKAGEFDDLVV